MNVRDILWRGACAFGDDTAVVSDGRTYSFRECWHRGVQLANGLRQRGAAVGDHIGVLEKNSIRSVDFYIAAAIGGFVRVPLYWRNANPVHLSMLESADCSLLVVDDDAGAVDALIRAHGEQRTIVRDESYERWLRTQSSTAVALDLDEDALCLIRHSGGTTGRPKGIPSTHRQWACIGRDVTAFKPRILPGEAMLHVAPLSHASGYYFLPAWAAGARQVLSPSTAADHLLETLVAEEIRHFFLPPTLLDSLATAALDDDRDFVLRSLAIGSAPVGMRTLRAARERFGDSVLYQTYGTSEAVPISGMGPEAWFAEYDDADPLTSAGRPLPFIDFALKDADGVSVPIGEIGEVVVRCDGMASSYYNAPEQTADRFVDRWFYTGDLGRLDSRGYLHLIDRVGELIVSGGHNVYPADLERVVSDLPGVGDVAAFGIPHEKWGETPVVVCQMTPGSETSADTVRDHVAVRLGSYMKPSLVVFEDDPLPKTPVGKIARRKIQQDYLATTADRRRQTR